MVFSIIISFKTSFNFIQFHKSWISYLWIIFLACPFAPRTSNSKVLTVKESQTIINWDGRQTTDGGGGVGNPYTQILFRTSHKQSSPKIHEKSTGFTTTIEFSSAAFSSCLGLHSSLSSIPSEMKIYGHMYWPPSSLEMIYRIPT